MLFSEAIGGTGGGGAGIVRSAGPEVEVERVVHDSREAGPGVIFVAMRGASSDGNRFIAHAVERGVSAVVTDDDSIFQSIPVTNPDLAVGFCEHGRRALAGVAAKLEGHPERDLKVTGVTGTNGKTTTTFLLEAMLQAAGRKVLLLGTIENHIDGRIIAAKHTTPEPDELYSLLRRGVDEGATECVMEVSSHGLEQGRVWGLEFEVAVFTNLTRDHLDFHGTMDAYRAAKRRLFAAGGTGAAAPHVAVLNADDAMGRELAAESRELFRNGRSVTDVVTYSLNGGDFYAEKIVFRATGSSFVMRAGGEGAAIKTSLAGRVNVWNILAASAAARARGVSLQQIAEGVGNLTSVPGRFQQVRCGQPFAVVVDYAHTDDALRNLTAMARELAVDRRVITVFGCGGDRDRTKRPLMAEAAAANSDVVVLTSDNPRTEVPAAILRDAEAGFAGSDTEYFVIEDRGTAIEHAIGLARPGDIVLLAGKGHEKTQTGRDGVVAFDDVAVAQAALEALGLCD